MAIPFTFDSNTIEADPIKITDIISLSSRKPSTETVITDQSTPSDHAPSSNSKPPSLKDIDKLFGPFRLGEYTVSRRELHAMGATVNGESITSSNTYFAEPDQTFIDSLELDPVKVEQRIKSIRKKRTHVVATLLFEIATRRSITAAPLLKESRQSTSITPVQKIGTLLKSTQRLDIHKNPVPDHLPSWVDKSKSYGMGSMGVGLQAYGLYSAIIGAADALKKGQWTEAAINIGGGAAEIGSLIVERGLAKTGEAMIRNGAKTFAHFGRTTMGQILSKGAGLIASILTLPFDLYTAIKAFNDAASTQGKEAQDHYVTAGLSLTSAGLSIILGGAALLGFQAAGPIGLAAAAIMIVGARIYGAARMVDDIDDYIELTVHERWRAGWFAFTGQDQDQEVMDRFTVAKTYSDYAKALESNSINWLKNELKDSVEAVVNGRYEVILKPTRYQKFQWDEAGGEPPFVTVNVPEINETDDVYDARDSLPPGAANIVEGEKGPAKGILWQLGGGNDEIIGIKSKPNYFNYASGSKFLTGGEQDDAFLFQSAVEGLKKIPERVSSLQGGSGADTLTLQGTHVPVRYGPDDNLYVGYDINLKNGTLGLRSPGSEVGSVLLSTIDSVEKVETLSGALNQITGSDQADTIVANGQDTIIAGEGDDQLIIRGNDCQVDGGSGVDTYHLSATINSTTITEDGKDVSFIYLGVTLELIQSWYIRDTALIISSLRIEDLSRPQRQLVITDIYEKQQGKRLLRNDRFLFVTEDGYQLKADLPAELNDTPDQSVKVVIVVTGIQKASPVIVNSHIQRVPRGEYSHYFVSRDTYRTVFAVDKPKTTTPSVLFVDYDSDEIGSVNAIYVVDATDRNSNTYLSYSNFQLQILFNNGRSLLIQGAVEENKRTVFDAGGGLMAFHWEMIHPFTLVMRDGNSYLIDFPKNSFFDDSKNLGYRVISSRASLIEKPGKYVFLKPAYDRRVLKPVAQRIDIEAASQQFVYSLEGQSSSYDIYPKSNTSLLLSTLGATTGTADSSTWNIYTQQLKEKISRRNISISDNLLKIGSVHIQLPGTDDPAKPLEVVNVVITSGNQYRIDTLFESMHLRVINAQAYTTVSAIQQDIDRHKQLDELPADLLPVKNICMADLTAGNIYYDTETKNWTLDTDWSRTVNNEDLTIIVETTPTKTA
ncbi:calcium-binding protein [Pseudomonas sp.]|uniref:calcium-binding protein n=1 Tax=Pseudomonas sp. TaxID=306 RepID=UPI003F300F0E